MGSDPVEAWANFFIAEASAAAALSGLLFVAISINLPRILEIPHLPNRAADALVLLVGALIVCSFGLVPHQPEWLLGVEYLVTGSLMWLVVTIHRIRARGAYEPDEWWRRLTPIALSQGASLPIMAAGAALAAGYPAGLYALAAGVLCCFLASVLYAWVLLVEIMR